MSKSAKIEELKADYRMYEVTDHIWDDINKPIEGDKHKYAVKFIHDRPPELFNSRKLKNLKALPKSLFDENGKCYLIKIKKAKPSELKPYGIKFDERGPYIEQRSKGEIFNVPQRYLPSVVHAPMLGELVPATSWGSNLHNLLSKQDWHKLRIVTLANASHRCEVCGSADNLECHELWTYHDPIMSLQGATNIGVQELRGLMALCPACHESHHLGFAKQQGKLTKALEHLALINQWKTDQLDKYYKYVSTAWLRRSQFMWVLDLSSLTLDEIIIQKRWCVEDGLFISAKTTTGMSVTKILGILWKCEGAKVSYSSSLRISLERNRPNTLT